MIIHNQICPCYMVDLVLLLFVQIGFIGLVEEEWLVTLATVDREEVTYMDFVTEGTKLAKELREEVRKRL